MKISKIRLFWDPSQAQDVEFYRIYVRTGSEPDYSADNFSVPASTTEVVLPDAMPSLFLGEGPYFVGVSAMDGSGNESDIAQASTPFDFTPPPAPTNVGWQGF